jgi:hypothetical protein
LFIAHFSAPAPLSHFREATKLRAQAVHESSIYGLFPSKSTDQGDSSKTGQLGRWDLIHGPFPSPHGVSVVFPKHSTSAFEGALFGDWRSCGQFAFTYLRKLWVPTSAA